MSAVDSLTGFGNSYLDTVKQNSVSSAENAASKDYSSATDRELLDACKEFETYFVEQMFKAMRATVHKEDSSESSYTDMFEDNLYQEYAKNAADSGQLGLAQTLYEQMKRTYELEEGKESE